MAKQKINSTQIQDDIWHVVGTTGEPAFANAWVNYDTTFFYSAAFYKDALGIVHLRGLVKTGTIGAAIFTLPVGYRPTRQVLIGITANNAIGRVDIQATGIVLPSVGNNTFYQLDNVSFKAEA